ncbi:hypothetical protein [Pusillimonas sp. NJUB218]|uniref:hypothetical protein n=1 Tax=Pusillimonas sp. NJUB218 TaxID=2023230 RepID=UPI000F4C3EA0|nr:hypothetical protein [Pusillimonas sp. NJUB218]ROT44569.1 hypothetical protein CHR62_11050 [Pusillimonas sp. NJUB218]
MSDEEHQHYLIAATKLGISLSEYLRLRLASVNENDVADQIAQLRLTILDNPSDVPTDLWPAVAEVVLLLRHICKPGDVRAAHAELTRSGVTPWRPSQDQKT